jgi:hypothetical protein
MPRRVLLASLSLLLVALSACSTKDATTENASTATTQPANSAGDPTADPEAPAPAASRAGSCPTQDQIDGVQSSVESAADGSSDELVAQFDAAYTFLGSYLPDELQADLTLVRASFASYMQALSGVDLSNPDALTDEQTAALDAASASVDNPEVQAANTRIEDYFTQTCPGVNFDEPDPSTSDSTPN